MAHSDEELEAELRDAVRDTVLKDRDSLTINSVRKLVEEKLDLEQGFFLSDSWKQRSKLLIKEAVVSASSPLRVHVPPMLTTSRHRRPLTTKRKYLETVPRNRPSGPETQHRNASRRQRTTARSTSRRRNQRRRRRGGRGRRRLLRSRGVAPTHLMRRARLK